MKEKNQQESLAKAKTQMTGLFIIIIIDLSLFIQT